MSSLELAWAQVRSRLLDLGLAVLVIALGVALAAGMLLANAALRESFEDSVDALAGRAELEIAPLAGGTLDESVLEKVREVPGVEVAAPLFLGSAFLEGERGGRVRLVGVDMLDDSTVRLYKSSPTQGAEIEDPLVFLNQPDSVIVPAGFVAERGLKRGDAIEVQTPMGRQRLVIRGVLEDAGVGRAFGGELAIMDLFAAQEVMGSPGRVTRIDVAVKEGEDAAEVAGRLREVLPGHLGITSVSERKAELRRTVAGFQALLNVIALMGLLLGALITANRLATVYQERLWEMGVLRGMGWTPGALVRDLLAEAALVSTFAVLIGLPLGVLFAQLIVGPVADTMALNFEQDIAAPRIALSWFPLTIAAVAGIGSGVLAAGFPGARAAGATIATLKALRRRRDPSPEMTSKQRLRILLPAAVVLAIALQLATGSAIVGALAMPLLFVAGAVLIQPGLRAVSRPFGNVAGSAAWIGLSDQSRAPSRAIGATAVLMTGLTLVVWMETTGESFQHRVLDTIMASRQADLIVDASSAADNMGGEPQLSEEIIPELAALPSVDAVGAETYGRFAGGEPGLVAVDANRLLDERSGSFRLEAPDPRNALELVARGEGFLADAQFLAHHGLEAGDRVNLITPSGPLDRPVVAVATISFISPTGHLVMNRELYRAHWHDPLINRAYLLIDDGASQADVREAIVNGPGRRYRLRVSEAGELASWLSDNVRRGFGFLDTMVLLTLLVVLIGTGDALAANVNERTREIGTLRSLGYRRSAIAGMVLVQALAIGSVGGCLAIALGLGMSVAFGRGVLPAMLGWRLDVYPTYAAAAAAAALGILACVLGGVIPAIRASRLSIVRALRYE